MAQISKKNSIYDKKWNRSWRFITPQIDRDPNCTKMHFWFKLDDSSLNGWPGDNLSYVQVQKGMNFDFKLNLTLKVKVNQLPKQ